MKPATPQARCRILGLWVLSCLLLTPGVVRGAPGDLDTSFGSGGIVMTAVDSLGSGAYVAPL